MPFLSLNNNWSNLAQYYNKPFNSKPQVPSAKYTDFDDGLIRGGLTNVGLASARDTARIGKFFASGKGLLFLARQVGLQLSNSQLETEGLPQSPLPTAGQGFLNNVGNAITNFIESKSPNRLYNLGVNTLTQIPLTALGGHIVRHGLLPIPSGASSFFGLLEGYNYEKIAIANNNASIQPLSSTSTTSGDDEVIVNPTLSFKNAPNRLLQHFKNVVKYGSNKKTKGVPVTLIDYSGGPGSAYGIIGRTTITTNPKYHTDSMALNDETQKLLFNGFKGAYTHGYRSLSYRSLDVLSSQYSVLNKAEKYNPINFVINPKENIENRVGVSSLGYKLEPTVGSSGESISRSVDSINTISIVNWTDFRKLSDANTPNNAVDRRYFTYTKGTEDRVTKGYFGRDIIKLRLEFLNNDTNIPEVLAFRAYIDDFQDGMQAKWNPYRYMGRGEDFYVYDGYTRDISLSFTMYAHSPAEMRPLYQKLNFLMSTFTPDYNSKNKMRGNIAYLTVGDYIYRQPGIFTDIKLSGMLDTHWEIAVNEPEGGNENIHYEVPKHIKIALSFKPIHDFLPRKSKVGSLDETPFITRNKSYGPNKYLAPDAVILPASDNNSTTPNTTTAALPNTNFTAPNTPVQTDPSGYSSNVGSEGSGNFPVKFNAQGYFGN